jgi:putative sigma-54 modulation protein
MNLNISGHHLEVSPALREYVLTKLERITRHFREVVDINVLLSVEKLKEKERRQKAEVTIRVKGKAIFAEQTHEDLYAAIDQLMDKLDRQVCRHKDKLRDHHHGAGKHFHEEYLAKDQSTESEPQDAEFVAAHVVVITTQPAQQEIILSDQDKVPLRQAA